MLGINKDPVTIKSIELAIVDRAFDEGWIVPRPPANRTWKKVAVIGSGPAGLAAAAQLNRAGHSVTVFEKSDRIGGLLRYGIPEFKLEKRVLNRRLDLLAAEGVVFRPRVNVGDDVPATDLRRDFDAILLAGGAGPAARPQRAWASTARACTSRWNTCPQQNRHCEGDEVAAVDHRGGQARRSSSAAAIPAPIVSAPRIARARQSVSQLELLPAPPQRARRRQSMAAVAQHLPHLVRA